MSDNAAMSAAIARMEAQSERAVVRQTSAGAREYRRQVDLAKLLPADWRDVKTLEWVNRPIASSAEIIRELERVVAQERSWGWSGDWKFSWNRLTSALMALEAEREMAKQRDAA